MKKFMKGCAITALILLVLGFVVTIAAGTVGGTKAVREVVESVTDGKIHINLGNDGEGFGIFFNEEEWFNNENVHYDISSDLIFDSAYEILHGDVERYQVGSDIRQLNIEVGGCVLKLEKSEDHYFYAEAKNIGKFQCYEKNGTLYVKTLGTEKEWTGIHQSEIWIYIPDNYRFDMLDVALGAGQVELGKIAAEAMDIEVGAGQITAAFLQSEQCDIEVGMGELVVNDMQVTKMNADVGMGHLMLCGTIMGDVNAECAMGAIEMNLTGNEEDFDYTLEAAVGNVSIANNDYSGLAKDKVIRNRADKKMNLECAMGNIQVAFENEAGD